MIQKGRSGCNNLNLAKIIELIILYTGYKNDYIMLKVKRRKLDKEEEAISPTSAQLERAKSDNQLAWFPFAQLQEEDSGDDSAMPKFELVAKSMPAAKPTPLRKKKVAVKRKEEESQEPEAKILPSDEQVHEVVVKESAAAYADEERNLTGNAGYGSSDDDQ